MTDQLKKLQAQLKESQELSEALGLEIDSLHAQGFTNESQELTPIWAKVESHWATQRQLVQTIKRISRQVKKAISQGVNVDDSFYVVL